MEKEKQFYKELPTGTGRESEPKETLPAVEIKNEVIWVNPDFPELPFNIKEGEPTRLGMFLTPKPKEKEKPFDLKILASHGRSALLGRVVLGDRQNRFYRDVDLKGAGYIGRGGIVEKVKGIGKKEALGILDKEWALHAKDMAEKLLEIGVRTERYLALIKIDELVNKDGIKISVNEARKKRILPKKVDPVIALRVLGTKFRIGDVVRFTLDSPPIEQISDRLDDARRLIVQELGLENEKFSFEDYSRWFAEIIGKNLGLIHKNNYYHEYLTDHNITLDGRIVDLDSIKKLPPNKQIRKDKMYNDYQSLGSTLLSFFELSPLKNKIKNFDTVEFINVFIESYKRTLGYVPEFLKEKK